MTHLDTTTAAQPETPDFSALWTSYFDSRGSFATLEPLLEAYLPFARKVLMRLMIRLPSHVKSEDLINSAIIGLYEAICRFDPNAGASFETFATRRVRGAVLDDLRAMDPLSRTQRDKVSAVEKAMDDWIARHNAFPEDEDIAKTMNMTIDELGMLMDAGQPWLSLDAPISLDGRTIMLGEALIEANAPAPDQEAQRQDARSLLRRAFRALADREQKILYLYYFEELTLREIGEAFELTEARICQIHALAIRKLKSALTQTGSHLL